MDVPLFFKFLEFLLSLRFPYVQSARYTAQLMRLIRSLSTIGVRAKPITWHSADLPLSGNLLFLHL